QDGGCLGQAGLGAEHDGEGLGLAGGRLKEELPGRGAQAGGGPAVGGVVAEADALVPGPGQRLGPAPSRAKYRSSPPLETRPSCQAKARCRVIRRPLGTNRSQGVTVRRAGWAAPFSTV